MQFYLYPLQKINYRIKWDYDKFFFERWLNEAYTALLEHPQRTDNPKQASFFVVSFTLICLSFIGFNKNELEEKMHNLPYWNEGNKHIVFDLTDFPYSFYTNKNVSVFKSAFSKKYYNKYKDVSIPQFPRYHFSDQLINNYTCNKSILFSFKGHPRTGHNPLRAILFSINNDDDCIIKAFSNNPSDFEFVINNGKMIVTLSDDKFSYLNLLFASTYSLLPRGNGCALSYRHIESMNAGSIPVIISDEYVLPFNELIDWKQCALQVKEANIQDLHCLISSHEKTNYTNTINNVKTVYDAYFSSTKQIINTALEIYMNKFSKS